jgi:type I restriction enzyme S subunit
MSEFEVQIENIFKQIDKLKEYNEKLAQARDLLLPKLMSGELTV